jgi:hypothetical protein
MRDWYEGARAKRTRKRLARAGVTRPRLTEDTGDHDDGRLRSWRDTGMTWLALAGVDVAKMKRRAGHDDVSTTMGYVNSAEDISDTIGTPFPPLPTERPVFQRETRRRGRDSNPSGALASEAFSENPVERAVEHLTRREMPRRPEPTSPIASPDAMDALEAVLARALDAAARAGRFDVVAQLARELEARRLAHEPNVIALAMEHRGR